MFAALLRTAGFRSSGGKKGVDSQSPAARLPANLTMKSNSLGTVLLAILAISALGSIVLCMFWISAVRESRGLQLQVVQIQRHQALANQLAAELVQYSDQHPAINKLLQDFKIKSSASNPPAPEK